MPDCVSEPDIFRSKVGNLGGFIKPTTYFV